MTSSAERFDVLVIGSGFGGSVAALRLSQKGYRVGVLEQGRRVQPHDMEQANHSLKSLFWMPALGLKGFFTQTFFQHVNIVGGVGVGGGSLVYAAVLLEPGPAFFHDPAWSDLGIDWQSELQPHYQTAAAVLGRTSCPLSGPMDEYLQETARALGVEDSFGPVPLGIYFGQPGVTRPDPFFGGQGPSRTGCDSSGTCLTGCAHNAKNSLDLNYLYLAEALGAQVLTERKVTLIRPLYDEAGQPDGYELSMFNPLNPRQSYPPLRAGKVILAAGVLGTLSLLFHCRDVAKTLPDISSRLGQTVRTNSEAIVGILSKDPDLDLTHGPTISSHFYFQQSDPRHPEPLPGRLHFYEALFRPAGGRASPAAPSVEDALGLYPSPLTVHCLMAGGELASSHDRVDRHAAAGQPALVPLRAQPVLALPSRPAVSLCLWKKSAHLPARSQPGSARLRGNVWRFAAEYPA